MKRMAVFVLYDFEGKVERYVEYLLKSLSTVVEKMIVVSNGNLGMQEKAKIEVLTEYIYERDNKGLDAGAYKDVFTAYVKNKEWEKWDEVILLNDSFYGPMYPWQEVFEKMDYQDVDFWGMTKVNELIREDEPIIPTYIQSYFIAVRKKMLCSDVFHFFWDKMDYPKDLYDAVVNFEMKFTDYFSKFNYKYLTYTDVMENNYITSRTSPYISYTLELLATTRMPLVKRKALTIDNFENARNTIKYISAYTEYDVELIKSHMIRLDSNHKLAPYGYMEIDDFCKRNPKIYIYGHGKYGHLVESYFRWRSHNYEKFIVTTKAESDGENVISYSDLKVDDQTGILLAVGKKNLDQILPIVAKDISASQLLVPRF